jgi:hypothetical protein
MQARDDELNKATTAYGLATGRQDAQLAQLTNSIAQGNSLNLGLSDVKCLSRLLKEAVESGMWDGKNGTYHNMEPSLLSVEYFFNRTKVCH